MTLQTQGPEKGRLRGWAGTARGRVGARGAVLTTVFCNLLVVGVNLGASVVVARQLGAAGRGSFASLTAVFALSLVLADLGQSSSVTYFTARDPSRRADWVVDGRRIMVVGGLVVTAAGGVVGLLIDTHAGLAPSDFVIVISACLVNGLAAPSVFALQALSITAWNVVRLLQPCIYTALVLTCYFSTRLSISLLAVLMVASVVSSLACALLVGYRYGLGAGTHDRQRSRQMLRYGASAYASGLPVAITQNADRIVIIAVLSATDAGHYAVAMSLMSLPGPVAIAIASIQFPRIAAVNRDVAQTQTLLRSGLRGSVATLLPVSVLVAAVGQWLMPAVFGSDFREATWILWALVPVGALRAMSIVTSGLLRGLGRPGTVAIAQASALVVLALSIVPACLIAGLAGLVIAVTCAEVVALAVCLPPLLRRASMS